MVKYVEYPARGIVLFPKSGSSCGELDLESGQSTIQQSGNDTAISNGTILIDDKVVVWEIPRDVWGDRFYDALKERL